MAFYETEDEQQRRYERETYERERDNQLGQGAMCCGFCEGWFEDLRRHILRCPERPADLSAYADLLGPEALR